MIRRFLCSGIAGSLLFVTAATSAQPSYCPTTAPSACGQAQIGDILITLAGSPSRVIGLNPSTGSYYVFSSALTFGGELGDIAVLPSNPVETVVIGRIHDGFTGVRKLDACGALVATAYGSIPDPWPLPFVPFPRSGTSNRGLVFSPLNAEAYSPGPSQPFFMQDSSVLYESLFKFPPGGGTASVLPVDGFLVDSVHRGAIAADEFGNVYIGESDTLDITKVAANGILSSTPHSDLIGSWAFNAIHDVVHDGNHHLFVTDLDAEGHGRVWRFNPSTSAAELWADNRGSFGGDPLNELTGITIDAFGDLWVAERYNWGTQRGGALKISGRGGGVIGYFQMPEQIPTNGDPAAGAWPTGIAVYGVNLPTIRERCEGTCGDSEISDCYGGCVPAAYMGDDICDSGPSYGFNCYARGFDGDYCNPCSPSEYPDCNGNCAPKSWVGDSVCDSGGWPYGGNWINYDCAEFRFDEAACAPCNGDETLDCNGHCAPIGWLGDDWCDAGGWEYLGNWIDLDCAEYDFDQNTCQ